VVRNGFSDLISGFTGVKNGFVGVGNDLVGEGSGFKCNEWHCASTCCKYCEEKLPFSSLVEH
jgi:hypothetical protein